MTGRKRHGTGTGKNGRTALAACLAAYDKDRPTRVRDGGRGPCKVLPPVLTRTALDTGAWSRITLSEDATEVLAK